MLSNPVAANPVAEEGDCEPVTKAHRGGHSENEGDDEGCDGGGWASEDDGDEAKYPQLLMQVEAALRYVASQGAIRAELEAEPVKLWQDRSGVLEYREAVARMYRAERWVPMPIETLSYGTYRKAPFPRYCFTLSYCDKKGTESEKLIEIPVGSEVEESETERVTRFFFSRLSGDLPFTKKGWEHPQIVWEWR